MKLNKIIALAAAAAFTVLAAGYANCDELNKIRIAQFGKEKFLFYLPLYLAIEQGYFRTNGLDVELIYAGNDDQVFAAVAGGSADIGIGDPVFTAIAQEKGFPAKTIGSMITKLAMIGYTKNPDIAEITSVEQLSGLKIGSFPKPSTTYTLLSKLIAGNNLQKDGTTIVEAGINSQLGLLNAGIVDIAIDLEPAVSKLETEGYKVVLSLPRFTQPQTITGLMAKESTIRENPSLLQAAVNSIQQSLTTIKFDPEAARQSACRIFPHYSCDVIIKALGRINHDNVYPEKITVDSEEWQRSLRLRLESKELKHPQTTQTAVDNQFALKAVNVADKIK